MLSTSGTAVGKQALESEDARHSIPIAAMGDYHEAMTRKAKDVCDCTKHQTPNTNLNFSPDQNLLETVCTHAHTRARTHARTLLTCPP